MVSRKMLLLMVAVCFVLMPQKVSAQQKVAVEVLHNGQDLLGQRLAYLVKEIIKRSDGLRLTNNNELRMRIYLVSVDIFEETPGKATACGWTTTLKNTTGPEIYLNSGVGTSVKLSVNGLADNLIPVFDKEANYLRMNLFK